ncbi:MAG: hypothetical protein SGI89_06855 [bacterium]|nr:hypothetical protein [bacterium]
MDQVLSTLYIPQALKMLKIPKFQIGNFPFGEKNISEYFSSTDVTILKSQVAKPGDTSYMVILDLQFKNLNSLNSLKAFSQLFDINVLNSDSGSVIKWNVNSGESAKLINLLNFILNFDGGIRSGNGSIKNGSIKWAKTDFSIPSEYSVTLNSKLTNSQAPEKKDPVHEFDIDKKPCGLFGMEFFIISFIGIIIIYPTKKSKKH